MPYNSSAGLGISKYGETYLMKNKLINTILLSSVLCAGISPVLAQDGFKQDMKHAGHETKAAAHDTGEGVEAGTEKTGHKIKHGSKRAWHSTKRGTRRAGHKVSHETHEGAENIERHTDPN